MDPDFAQGHQWYAEWLLAMNMPDSAIAEEHRAVELDPASPVIRWSLVRALRLGRRYAEAVQAALEGMEMGRDPLMAVELAQSYLALGQPDTAAVWMAESLRQMGAPEPVVAHHAAQFDSVGMLAFAATLPPDPMALPDSVFATLAEPVAMLYAVAGDVRAHAGPAGTRPFPASPLQDDSRSRPEFPTGSHPVGSAFQGDPGRHEVAGYKGIEGSGVMGVSDSGRGCRKRWGTGRFGDEGLQGLSDDHGFDSLSQFLTFLLTQSLIPRSPVSAPHSGTPARAAADSKSSAPDTSRGLRSAHPPPPAPTSPRPTPLSAPGRTAPR